MRFAGLHGSAALVAGLAVTASCYSPTEVLLDVRTDLACGAFKNVAIWTTPTDLDSLGPPTTETTRCEGAAPADIGRLVVLPSGDRDAKLRITVVMGITTPAGTCEASGYKGCIVARRLVRYIAHTSRVLPISLTSSCIGRPCSPDTTCLAGECTPADVDDSRFCAEPGCPVPAGDGGTDAALEAAPVDAAPANLVVQIAAGESHTCARFADGRLKCWGVASVGQLGLESASSRGGKPGEMGKSLPFVDVGGPVAALATGGFHTCALLLDGRVKCWGLSTSGQLGLARKGFVGTKPGEMGAALPALDLPIGSVASITAGGAHTCMRSTSGSLRCWGFNTSGQLGIGNTVLQGDDETVAAVPDVALGAGRTCTLVEAASQHTCALLDDGALKCWGFDAQGQLGIESTNNLGQAPGDVAAAAAIKLGTDLRARAFVGGYAHTCALMDNAAFTLKCWGDNLSGQLGFGTATSHGDQAGEMGNALPGIQLGTNLHASQVAAGNGFTCALLQTGDVKCWGRNNFGQLGLGDTTQRGVEGVGMGDALPIVPLGGRVRAVTAGAYHACALLESGAVKCWGDNRDGQLGQGDTVTRGDGPSEVLAMPPVDLGVP